LYGSRSCAVAAILPTPEPELTEEDYVHSARAAASSAGPDLLKELR
jgi:hypothetical protein